MSSVLRSDWAPVGWRRDAAIAQLEAQRKADPAAKARKHAKKKVARLKNAARYCAVGEALPPELLAKVRANPKACTHFFGGEKGCTMRDKCRFLHAL